MKWRVVPPRRAFFISIWFPSATFLLLIKSQPWLTATILALLHLAFLIGGIAFLNCIGNKNQALLEKSANLKLGSAVISATTPLVLIIPRWWWAAEKDLVDDFSLYLLGLVCIFGGLTGLFINCETNAPTISLSHLKMLYQERLQLIWPCVFFFVITFIASPFVAQRLAGGRLSEPWALGAAVWVGMIGFTTLILMPLQNVQEIREAIVKRENRGGE